MRRLLLVSLLVLTVRFGEASGESQIIRTAGGAGVELAAAAFEPGQIVLLRLVSAAASQEVIVRFCGRDYVLGSEQSFDLAGLDLGLQPGPQKVRVTALDKDGRRESAESEIPVAARDFPVKKLWVKQEYVTPPPEVRERIEREAEILDLVYGQRTERWLGTGRFVRPHDGGMTPNFGERRIYNGVPRSTHSGVDISAGAGSPVRAANSGRVVLARDLYFSGKTVIIDHGLGLFTLYCHFSKLRVKRGEVVKKGQVIALAGSTGRSTGPHLHWGARILKSRVDPVALLNLTLPE